MDDRTFNDQKSTLDWAIGVEGENGRVRDSDIYPRLKAWVKRASPLTILDIGCGQGICSDKLDLDGRHYTGVEPSPFLLNRARELYPGKNREFLSGSVYDLPFSDEAFDAAFSVSLWHLLSDVQKAAQEVSRVLKANGHFLIITANPSAYSAWTNYKKPEDVLYLHTFDEILRSLDAVHLKVIMVETFRTTADSKGQQLYISIEGQKLQ